jgi:hypothetical protein
MRSNATRVARQGKMSVIDCEVNSCSGSNWEPRRRASEVTLSLSGSQSFCPASEAYKRHRRAKAELSHRNDSLLLSNRVETLESLRRLIFCGVVIRRKMLLVRIIDCLC